MTRITFHEKEPPMTRFASFILRTAALSALPLAALAHEGHGADGIHWHATDTWGFVVTLGLVGAAIWLGRKK
jgi:hypothetical protein